MNQQKYDFWMRERKSFSCPIFFLVFMYHLAKKEISNVKQILCVCQCQKRISHSNWSEFLKHIYGDFVQYELISFRFFSLFFHPILAPWQSLCKWVSNAWGGTMFVVYVFICVAACVVSRRAKQGKKNLKEKRVFKHTDMNWLCRMRVFNPH